MTNAAKPDLCVITGDFVCHSQKFLDELYEVISAIEAQWRGELSAWLAGDLWLAILYVAVVVAPLRGVRKTLKLSYGSVPGSCL